MKPVYISATQQDSGKTTVIVGLLQALRDLGHDVGYMKPVGQRYVRFEGANVDEDAVLARQAFGLTDFPLDMSPVAVERGFTERYIFDRRPAPLEDRIRAAFDRLRAVHDAMVIEGTGHAGVGSCFDLSNARVADLLGAQVLIVTEGGIGRALDEVALSYHLFQKHGVQVLGVILNKVRADKLSKVERAVSKGLAHLGTRLLGIVPYRSLLVNPRMDQVAAEVSGRILCGGQAITNTVEHTVVAAMEPEHVCTYIRENTLVVTPGDRIDNILVSIVACPMELDASRRVSGMVLTGGFHPPTSILALLEKAGIPVVLCSQDTYSVASLLKEMRIKIRAEDADKIEAAKHLIRESVNISALVAALSDKH